ncbi:hypothetical protein K402DRAFT_167101 [Aulographum hederae CBS 113979]|uniref:Uncharacterized protein n=1 Tax=Aulographum hederae CBS 113979 TaxID=1176131 RepID=A0A6G1GR95_9PEZI|nr:hypothetical protein K402DRAFT_167101 [Aulographum hederae CBS 113979]
MMKNNKPTTATALPLYTSSLSSLSSPPPSARPLSCLLPPISLLATCIPYQATCLRNPICAIILQAQSRSPHAPTGQWQVREESW